MKILSVRHAALPALLLPLIAAAQAADEQTMVVTAAPTTVLNSIIPAAVSVVNGDEMRQAVPRVNLSESLGAVPGLRCRTGKTMPRICSCRFAALARAQPMACADYASMWMAFRPPCPDGRADPQI